MWSCVAVLVILMSKLPVYVETKKAEELQAGVMLSQFITNLQTGLKIYTEQVCASIK